MRAAHPRTLVKKIFPTAQMRKDEIGNYIVVGNKIIAYGIGRNAWQNALNKIKKVK